MNEVKLPSNEELARLGPEQLLELLVLVRRCKEALRDGGGIGLMPASAVQDLVKAVPDDLVQAIVQDHRHGPGEPGWLPPEKPTERAKGSGWQKPLPLEGSVPGIKYVDQLCDVQDAVDRADNARRMAHAVGGMKRRV